MRVVDGTFGKFYGCTSFPECRKTLPYPYSTIYYPLLKLLQLKIGKYTYILIRRTDE